MFPSVSDVILSREERNVSLFHLKCKAIQLIEKLDFCCRHGNLHRQSAPGNDKKASIDSIDN